MGLVKARLRNASADPPSAPEWIAVLFNPTEYSIRRDVHYAEIQIPGLQMPLLQFVRGESQVLSLELFLDKSATGESVKKNLEELRQFIRVDGHLHAPPVCEFEWGDVNFRGAVTSFKERFVLFDESGRILRARLTLELKSYQSVEEQAKEANPQSPDRTRTRVVVEGDRLDSIAADEYGDPTRWRAVAAANGIARPRFLEPGTTLLIPTL